MPCKQHGLLTFDSLYNIKMFVVVECLQSGSILYKVMNLKGGSQQQSF